MARAPESPFRFVVSDLLAEAGRRRVERLSAPVSWALEMSAPVPGSELSAEATFESALGGIFVRCEATVPYRSTCHRCLVEWDHDETVAVTEALAAVSIEANGEDPMTPPVRMGNGRERVPAGDRETERGESGLLGGGCWHLRS